jgi:hypothetical protein
MVELREPQRATPHRRARFQVIDGEREPADASQPPHAAPSLSVVRGDQPAEAAEDAPAAGVEAMSTSVTPSPASAAVAVTAPEEPQRALEAAPAPARAASLSAVGNAAIGFVLAELSWGDQVIAAQRVQPGQPLTAGQEPGCDLFFTGLGRAEVVTSDAAGWQLRAPPPMALSLVRRGTVSSGAELLARGQGRMEGDGLVVPLSSDACGVLRAGSLSLRVRVMPSHPAIGREREELKGTLITSAVAFALLLALGLMHRYLPAPRVVLPPAPAPREYFVKTATPKKEPPPPEKQRAQGRKDPGQAFARHQGKEGMAGSTTAPRRNLRAEKKRDDAAIVARSGLLKALRSGTNSDTAFGTALGTGTRDALGHLDGPRVGDARGDGGAGLRSLGGTGGGGDGSGLGLARIGTNGIGGGLADHGEGRGSIKGKANAAIGLLSAKPDVQGEIDPELIRKVVHDHRAQIRACYEQELNSKPKLAGKVTTAWTIDAAGLVTESHVAESTLGDNAVERCVTSRIKTWRFPIPKGGGEVFVTYPFIFTRGG